MLYANAITHLVLISEGHFIILKNHPKDYIVQFKDNDGNIKYKQSDHLYENKKMYIMPAEEYDRAKKGRKHAYDFIHKNGNFKYEVMYNGKSLIN